MGAPALFAGQRAFGCYLGKIEEIEKTKDYPTRSYYCNLFMQYDFFDRVGEMHFTPPVQTMYALQQAVKEYFEEGEQVRWERLTKCWEAINSPLLKIDVDTKGLRRILSLGCV